MAISEMTDSGPCVTEEALATLETKLQARLPAPYRRFLRKYNGGRPEPSYFQRFTLHTFYSVGLRAKMHDLLANQRRMRKWLPDEVIPIADDDFGNEICLAVRGKNRGKVYFWDHEGGPPDDDPWLRLRHLIYREGDQPKEPLAKTIRIDWPGHPDLTLIAGSFTEFLDSFHDFDETEAGTGADAPPKAKKPPPKAKKPPPKSNKNSRKP
jgi:hypothetical protein